MRYGRISLNYLVFSNLTQVATYKVLNKKTMFFLKNKGFSLILDVFCYKSGLETPPTREFTKSVATWVNLDVCRKSHELARYTEYHTCILS